MMFRNNEIVLAAKDGVSLTALARRFGISRQRIWQIVHSEKRLGLFSRDCNEMNGVVRAVC